MIQRSVSFWCFWKCIAWIIEVFGSDSESTYMYIFLLIFFGDDLFGNGMMRLWRLYILLVLVNSRPANCDSLMELGQSSTSANYSRFPEGCLKRRNSCGLQYFGILPLVVLSKRKLSCEHFSSSFSLTTFTMHSFGRDRYIMTALTLSDKICVCIADKYIQFFCILLRSSMNPRFLCICNYFCFAGIVVETNCTPTIVEEMCVFLLYECEHHPYNSQSSFCNRINDLLLNPRYWWIVLL